MSAAAIQSFDKVEFETKVTETVAKIRLRRPQMKMLRPGYVTKIGRGRCGKLKRLQTSQVKVKKDSPKKREVFDFNNKVICKVFEANNNKAGGENINTGDYTKAFVSFCQETIERKNLQWDGVINKKTIDKKRKVEKEDELKNGKPKDPLRDIEIGNIRSGNFTEDQFSQNFDVMVDNFIKLNEEELRLNREMRMNKRRKVMEVNLAESSRHAATAKSNQNAKINKSLQQGARKLLSKNAAEMSNNQLGNKSATASNRKSLSDVTPTIIKTIPVSKNSPQVANKTNVQMAKRSVGQQNQSNQRTASPQPRNKSTPQIVKSVPQTSNKTPQNVIKSTPQMTNKKSTPTVVEKQNRPNVSKPATKSKSEVTIDLLDDDDDPIISKQVNGPGKISASAVGPARNVPPVSNRLNSSSQEPRPANPDMSSSRRSLPEDPTKSSGGGIKRILPGGQVVAPDKPVAGKGRGGRKSLPEDGGIKRILPGGQMAAPEKPGNTAGRGKKAVVEEPPKVTAGGIKRIMPGGKMMVPNQQAANSPKPSIAKTAEVVNIVAGGTPKIVQTGPSKASPANQPAKQPGKTGRPPIQKTAPPQNNKNIKDQPMIDDLKSRGVKIINGKTPMQVKTPVQSKTIGITQTKTPVSGFQTKTTVNGSQMKTPVTGSQVKTPVSASMTKTPTITKTKTPVSVKPSGKPSAKPTPGGKSTQEPELKKVQLSQKQMAALQSLGLM